MEDRKMAEFVLEMLNFWDSWDCKAICEDCVFGENGRKICNYLDRSRRILNRALSDD